MKEKRSATNRIILCMTALYLLFLVWAILWKCSTPFIGDSTQRIINLIPFNQNTNWEILLNVVLFIPFGFCFAANKKAFKVVRLIWITALFSLMLEVLQYVLGVGRSDITDLIVNTFGGIIGVVAFKAIARLFGKHERKVTLVLCSILTLFEIYMAISFLFLGQLYLGFMVFRL